MLRDGGGLVIVKKLLIANKEEMRTIMWIELKPV